MPTKASDLRELETEELSERVGQLRARLFELRSRQARKELEGGLEIRHTRHDLARVMTILKERANQAPSREGVD